jgi:DNA-binding transcriptional LysR family regulator
MSKNRTIDQIDLRRLSVFRAVVESGGVTAAAAAMHRSPSAVSDDLAVLQRHLGTPLFEKVGRRLQPTAKARALARSLERAYLDLQEAWDTAVAEGVGEPLRIAAVTGFGRYRLLPALLPAMPVERRLEVRFSTADEIRELIERGRVDLGVSYRPLVGEGIASRAVATEDIVLVGPPGSTAPEEPADLRFPAPTLAALGSLRRAGRDPGVGGEWPGLVCRPCRCGALAHVRWACCGARLRFFGVHEYHLCRSAGALARG